MFVHCICKRSSDVSMPPKGARVRLRCDYCKRPIITVGVEDYKKWIKAYVDRLEKARLEGKIGTRRQTTKESDHSISMAGTSAELAACLILAPWSLADWMKRTESSKPNRGCDLPASWLGGNRPVEVKYTAHRNGHLLIRPPRGTIGPMLAEYVNDSIYVLMTDDLRPDTYTAVGWVGRSDFLKHGNRKPVPVGERQRDCWGVRADRLNSMKFLFSLLPDEENAR